MTRQGLSAAEYADQETRYGIIPMLRSDRIYGFWDVVWVAGAYGIATWCYFQGGALASVMDFRQTLISTLGVSCGLILLITVVAVFCCRYGIDHWIYFRACLGWTGAQALLLVTLSTTWGYEAINAQMFGSSIIKVVNEAGGSVDASYAKWIGLVCVFLGWVIAIKGALAVKIATRIMGLALVAVGGIIVVILVWKADPGTIWNAQASAPLEDNRASYMLGTEWNVAFTLGWFPVIGALARLARTERGAHWGMWSGYGLLFGIFIIIGAAAAYVGVAMGSDASGDPTDYLMQVGGTALGLISVGAIAIANITTQAVATYLMSVSTKILNPAWSYKWIATFWCALSGVLTAWGAIWDYYPRFLAVIGAISGPAIALVALDYWVIRRGRFSMSELFRKGVYTYTLGFNLVAVAAFGAGVAAYLLVYDPIAYVARYEPIFNLFTATGFAAIVTAAAYLALVQVPALKRYVLRDADVPRVGQAPEKVGEAPAGVAGAQ